MIYKIHWKILRRLLRFIEKLEKILEIEELPNIKKYWELLKSRESYKKGILDFFGEKENGDIESVFGKKDSMHLEPLTQMIKNYES